MAQTRFHKSGARTGTKAAAARWLTGHPVGIDMGDRAEQSGGMAENENW
jgi:hypothetical protein